jgi:DNA-binding FadR family transcriptional regulator
VREQLEVARALGLVEVKSKTGMKMRSYSFTPAVRLSLFFALAQDQRNFELFGEVRNHMEVAFWNEACARLEDEDKRVMRDCLDKAHAKLNGKPVRIPTEEHRTFHLTVFKRLDNPFVMGILEAYWDAYNAVELNRYSDYSYLQQVWSYHERIFEAICNGDYERAKSLFIDHTNLIRFQPWMQRIHAATDLRDGNE